jgi:phosphoribosylglycinamide formyltransferase-1
MVVNILCEIPSNIQIRAVLMVWYARDMSKRVESRLAVLISGNGSIRVAMADKGVPIALVLADRPCAGLVTARQRGFTTELLERTSFGPGFDYVAYSQQLAGVLQAHGITKVAMAGWMTILAAPMFQPESYAGRILNTHPSLLPAFPGAQAVRQALAAGVRETGCTIHVATARLDTGPIVAQRRVPVRPDDTETSLHERIKVAERELYPEVVQRWLAGELQIEGLAL